MFRSMNARLPVFVLFLLMCSKIMMYKFPENTHTITIKSCNKAIGTISVIRGILCNDNIGLSVYLLQRRPIHVLYLFVNKQ